MGAAATPAIVSAGTSAARTRCNSAMRATVAVHATGSSTPPRIVALDVIGEDPAEFPVRGDDRWRGPRVDVRDQLGECDLMGEDPGNRLGPHAPAVGFEPRDRRARPDPDRFQRGPATDPALGEPSVRPGRHIGPPRRVVVCGGASREPR